VGMARAAASQKALSQTASGEGPCNDEVRIERSYT
jgi:hypothetical protein